MPWPTTGFEDRVAAGAATISYTTREEEDAFLAALAAETPRMSYSSVGTTQGGRNMWQAVVSYPTATTVGKRVVFAVAAQHGDEPSGREAIFKHMRALCQATDQATLDYLTQVAWVYIPLVNRDNIRTLAEGQRLLTSGNDCNRAHFTLVDPEPRAVDKQIALLDPDLVMDLHEDSTPLADWQYNGSEHPMVPTVLKNLIVSWVHTAVKNAVEAMPHTSFQYSPDLAAEGTLRNSCMLRCIPYILSETRDAGTTSSGNSQRQIGTAIHLKVLETTQEYHRTNLATFASVKQQAADAVKARTYSAYTLDWSNGTTTATPPKGYSMSAAQQTNYSAKIADAGIKSYMSGSTRIVPMHQRRAGWVAYGVDGRASQEMFSATALTSLPLPVLRQSGVAKTVTSQRRGGVAKTMSDYRIGWMN